MKSAIWICKALWITAILIYVLFFRDEKKEKMVPLTDMLIIIVGVVGAALIARFTR